MKKIKKIATLLVLFVLVLSFSSCELVWFFLHAGELTDAAKATAYATQEIFEEISNKLDSDPSATSVSGQGWIGSISEFESDGADKVKFHVVVTFKDYSPSEENHKYKFTGGSLVVDYDDISKNSYVDYVISGNKLLVANSNEMTYKFGIQGKIDKDNHTLDKDTFNVTALKLNGEDKTDDANKLKDVIGDILFKSN